LKINYLYFNKKKLLGTELFNLKKYEEAIAALNKLIGINPTFYEAFFTKGILI
jgi:tetratricopeptide (TPR) repeat protein